MNNLEIYKGGTKFFYYFEIVNKSQKRDNLISEILDETAKKLFLNYDDIQVGTPASRRLVDNIMHARFYKIEPLTPDECTSHKISQKDFIEIIPDENSVDKRLRNDFYYHNLEIKNGELDIINSWTLLRKKYKAISAYKKVDDPENWKPCKDCGLIPLVWSFNNGNSTACGCGENEYRHHSIRAESIMSYVTRNSGSALGYGHRELRDNWNTWVETSEDVFSKKKESIPEIW